MNLQLNSYHKKDRGSIHRAPHERVSAATLILCIVVEGVNKEVLLLSLKSRRVAMITVVVAAREKKKKRVVDWVRAYLAQFKIDPPGHGSATC